MIEQFMLVHSYALYDSKEYFTNTFYFCYCQAFGIQLMRKINDLEGTAVSRGHLHKPTHKANAKYCFQRPSPKAVLESRLKMLSRKAVSKF